MDVKTAFLYGKVEENIYVEQLLEFVGDPKKVCKLNRALYGLKQAPRVWYQTLSKYLQSLGFESLDSDTGIFARYNYYIAVYVDDLLVIGPAILEINKIKAALSDRFHMSDLGPAKYYLGMAIERNRAQRTLRLSQRAYLEKVLREFGFWDLDRPINQRSRPVYMLMTAEIEIPANEFNPDPLDREWY